MSIYLFAFVTNSFFIVMGNIDYGTAPSIEATDLYSK